MADDALKVGDLAARTGVSIRTLHHYDDIGLLSPRHRSPSGHRLYRRADIIRLQQIVSLRQMGLSLDQIRGALNRPQQRAQIIRSHIEHLKKQIAAQQDLCRRLEMITAKGELASIDEIIETIEVMTMFEKYYTKEQLESLKNRAETLGEDHIRAVEAEWPELIGQVRAEMQRGTDPKDPRVQALAKRWNELVQEFTGGDPGIEKSLAKFYQGEPQAGAKYSLDPGIFAYVQEALKEGGAG